MMERFWNLAWTIESRQW